MKEKRKIRMLVCNEHPNGRFYTLWALNAMQDTLFVDAVTVVGLFSFPAQVNTNSLGPRIKYATQAWSKAKILRWIREHGGEEVKL